jgi:hypothetical protein
MKENDEISPRIPLYISFLDDLIIFCPVALHTALNRFMPIFQIALILRAV